MTRNVCSPNRAETSRRPTGIPSRLWRMAILWSLAVLCFAWFLAARPFLHNGAAVGAVPTVCVRRGNVELTVVMDGEVRGGNPEVISAPVVGSDLQVTFLRKTGEPVKSGDIVVQFDTAQQQLKLRQAEASQEKAEQELIKARAEAAAQTEENAFALVQARASVYEAELETRRNPLLSVLAARQNELALDQARSKLDEVERGLRSRKTVDDASIEMKNTAIDAAKVEAATARQNIAKMTIRARSSGYVYVLPNAGGGFGISGRDLFPFKTGDRAAAGMAIAEIPDLRTLQVVADLPESERGRVAHGQPVRIQTIAFPFRSFAGEVTEIGGNMGSPWEQRVECRMSIRNPAPELRPGMNARITITSDVLRNVVSLPGQAVFENDGRPVVYVLGSSGFGEREVRLLRRGESQAIVDGLEEGCRVALANPETLGKGSAEHQSATGAIPRRER